MNKSTTQSQNLIECKYNFHKRRSTIQELQQDPSPFLVNKASHYQDRSPTNEAKSKSTKTKLVETQHDSKKMSKQLQPSSKGTCQSQLQLAREKIHQIHL